MTAKYDPFGEITVIGSITRSASGVKYNTSSDRRIKREVRNDVRWWMWVTAGAVAGFAIGYSIGLAL